MILGETFQGFRICEHFVQLSVTLTNLPTKIVPKLSAGRNLASHF